jgi:MoaA/NifB/PqqE/SkfB family radical SAM enzyme
MIKTTAITLKNPEKLMVTWDVGRRCNYDCTYCESTRHNNHSPHPSYEELIETFYFIKNYTDLYSEKRKDEQDVNINFTGGEPTVNRNFWKLAEYIKLNYPNFRLSLTTNGAWDPKKTEDIAKWFSGVTVSYHAEADTSLKKKARENIFLLKEKNLWLQVNVMMHQDYFEECKSLCYELKEHGINHIPRPIGDGIQERKGWFIDADGKNRKTTHEYTIDQQSWYFDYLGVKSIPTKESIGTDMGRSCCGGRCTLGKVDGEWKEVKIVDNNFFGWNCSVNWFFLHLDQHTGNVYHHQTCQARYDGTTGAIGTLKDTTLILDNLKKYLENPKPIICPNKKCGCGMCVLKSQDYQEFKQLWKSISIVEI